MGHFEKGRYVKYDTDIWESCDGNLIISTNKTTPPCNQYNTDKGWIDENDIPPDPILLRIMELEKQVEDLKKCMKE